MSLPESESVPLTEPVPDGADVVVEKPRRRSPRRKAAEVTEVVDHDAVAAAAIDAGSVGSAQATSDVATRAAPLEPAMAPSAASASPAGAPGFDTGVSAPVGISGESFSDTPQSDQTAAAGPASDNGDADGMDPNGRRRPRNRRRGRRNGRDGEAGSADPALADGSPGAGQSAPSGDALGDAADAATADIADEPPVVVVGADDRFGDVFSGAYDAEPPADPTPASRRILAPEPDAPKLHKVLAQSGIGSRRDMEQLIADGQVTVNGQPAHTGQRISFGDQIKVSGKPVKVRIAPPPARILAYHKPAGEVVTHDDPQHRPTVFRRLPRLPHGKWLSVGRLDINTEGLLLFTNSGGLANQLMHPRFGVEREYAVRVLGDLNSEAREKLLAGVDIDGYTGAFKSILDGGGDGANRWYRVVISEGRHREVRRLFDAVGLTVSRLIRVRYGCIVLPRGLRRGVWVALSEDDVRAVRRLASGPAAPMGAPAVGAQPAGPNAPAGDEGSGPRHNKRRRGRHGRPERDDRPDRPDRPERQDRAERSPQPQRAEGEREEGDDFSRIPNPLLQTYDRRAFKEANQKRREYGEDGPIPNPLQQTYDKRFAQGPRRPGPPRDHDPTQIPDPMRTSVGYIGADTFYKQLERKGGGGGGKRRRR